MPTPSATPPLGYQLKNLPAFIRPANQNTQIIPAAPKAFSNNATIAADVDPKNPTTINVRQPQMFTQPVQTHEATHVYQLSRNNDFLDDAMDTKNFVGKNAGTLLDYGGISGLENAINQRKTIANFNAEQQAQIVSDYQRLVADAIKKGDRKALSRVTAAYHPFVSQLASIPPRGADMTKMTKQDLSPAAPSVPPATVAGMPMVPDPLLGGEPKPSAGQFKSIKNNDILAPGDGRAKPINPYPNPEDRPPDESFAFNKAWTKPDWKLTTLSPQDENKFQAWAKANPNAVRGELNNPKADYDVRAHWLAAQHGDPAATLVLNKWDGKMHGNDKFKTPYNGGFSNESMYATPNAPRWVGDKLMTADGRLVADETPKPKTPSHKIGEIRRYPNGRIGVWDGHGWEAKRQ